MTNALEMGFESLMPIEMPFTSTKTKQRAMPKRRKPSGTFMIVTLFLMGMMQSVWVHRNISPVLKKAGAHRPDPAEDEEV